MADMLNLIKQAGIDLVYAGRVRKGVRFDLFFNKSNLTPLTMIK